MLFVVPPVMILAGWAKGTRPEERRLVAVTALLLAIGLVPAIVLTEHGAGELAQGCVYALAVMVTTCLAMLVHRRPGRDDGDGGSDAEPTDPLPGGPDLLPFDWDDFERRFWQDVERRRTGPRVPVA